MLILRGLRCTKIVLIRPRSSKGDSTVGQEGCRQMPQKEKRESSSPFVGKVFSKFNCTKGITKVKENSGGGHIPFLVTAFSRTWQIFGQDGFRSLSQTRLLCLCWNVIGSTAKCSSSRNRKELVASR